MRPLGSGCCDKQACYWITKPPDVAMFASVI